MTVAAPDILLAFPRTRRAAGPTSGNTAPGSATRPFPGFPAEIKTADGTSIDGAGGGLLTLTRPWPAMPAAFASLAREAAGRASFAAFEPDACLINCYAPGARMSLHQDRDERDLEAPIVSVSLGLPATFLWGGLERTVRPRRIMLSHGDVVVWGGSSRLVFHGVAPLQDGWHDLLGRRRVNLTLRRAL